MAKLEPTPRPVSEAPEVAEIPMGVRRLAAWSWRLILIVAAASLVIMAIGQFATLAIGFLIAILLAALLNPVVRILTQYTFLGRGASAAIALLGTILVILGMFTLAGRQLIAQWDDIQDKTVGGFQEIVNWLDKSLGVDGTVIQEGVDEVVKYVQGNAGGIASSAITTASSTASIVGQFGTGLLVCLFSLFFLLAGGSGIWRWCVGLLPMEARVPTHEAFRRGWKALSSYVRTQILVAAIDATGIAAGVWILGLGAYAVPIWLIVFLFSFIPLLGAFLSGAIATLIVLVMNGFWPAVIMLAIVILVQQIESNVLQPLIMGKAVSLHPLGVFLGVTLGAMVAGIAGALFSIPLFAFVNAVMLHYVGRDPAPEMGTDEVAAQYFRDRTVPDGA